MTRNDNLNTATNDVQRVLVIGASGSVGGALVRQLIRTGVAVRAATRHPRAPLPTGVEQVSVDLSEPSTLAEALGDVDSVHLIWPFFESGEETRRKVTPIARLLGERVRRVVYVSALGAAGDPDSFWHLVEDAIVEHVPEWTVLRPTGFAANARQWASQIRSGDVVSWPFADLARPLIHEADIAAVSATALTEGGHHGRKYEITGPAAITQRDQVAQIGAAIGKTLRWNEISSAQAEQDLGVPASMLEAWDAMRHTPEPVNDVVAHLTGRPARSFAQWATDHASDFTTEVREAS